MLPGDGPRVGGLFPREEVRSQVHLSQLALLFSPLLPTCVSLRGVSRGEGHFPGSPAPLCLVLSGIFDVSGLVPSARLLVLASWRQHLVSGVALVFSI